MIDPTELRRSLRAKRRELSADIAGASAAAAAAERYRAEIGVTAGDRLGLYRAHDGELDPLPLEALAAALGVAVYLPVVANTTLGFGLVDENTIMRPNRFGIDEPADVAVVAAEDLDVIVVPLVAFDGRGHRLGYGQGYYDRALSFRLRGSDGPNGPAPPLLVGYAWDEQEIAEVANHQADVALDVIVTPTRVIRPV